MRTPVDHRASSRRRKSSSEMLCPDGLFGLARNTMSGVCSLIACTATSTSRLKSSARLADKPRGLGAVGDDGVHRVRRHESDGAAARAAEGLQKLLQDLVGTVCRPEVLDVQVDAGLRGRGTRPGPCAAPPRPGPGSGAAPRDRAAPTPPRRRRAPWWAGAGSRWC